MAEYEARRCVVCNCRHPSFGFGPPLHGKGTIWACGQHRAEVDRQLRTAGLITDANSPCQEPGAMQLSLFDRQSPATE
jgi:hypothetical protein